MSYFTRVEAACGCCILTIPEGGKLGGKAKGEEGPKGEEGAKGEGPKGEEGAKGEGEQLLRLEDRVRKLLLKKIKKLKDKSASWASIAQMGTKLMPKGEAKKS